MKKAKVLFLALILGLSARAADVPVVFTYDTTKPQERFEINVPVPDGNYLVTLQVGSRKRAGRTFVKSESRRLSVNDLATAKGEFKTVQFLVNKRDKTIREAGKDPVQVITKPREKAKLDWDDFLNLEIDGDAPAVASVRIEPAPEGVTTIFLCGDSTVVDQDKEPWASWGQMFTYWLTDQVAVANYAESGLTASSFYAQNRLKKILSLAKAGDFVFIEFGHNDQKEKAAGSGAYYNFAHMLKTYVDQIREKGAVPIFVTPTQRRRFEGNKIVETHGQYPDAMRFVAKDLGVELIELHDMTRTFFEALGVEDSKRSLVHYPAGTFPNQGKAFEDNTHWNPYGAYEISRMIVKGINELNLPLTKYIKPDYQDYDPAQPDDWKAFHWSCGPFIDIVKPDGN